MPSQSAICSLQPAIPRGFFLSFEGTEGGGKSTQAVLLARRLRDMGYTVRELREPGGTPIGEEIRHTLKHSHANHAMTPEAELLLMNASRAQIVREVIRPALAAGEIIVCDRFYDSTTAYQGYGRGLNLAVVRAVVDFAVGGTRPNLTLLFLVPPQVSYQRRMARQSTLAFVRDRFEEADQSFFERVDHGYREIAAAEPERIRNVDAVGPVEEVAACVWALVSPRLPKSERG